MWKKMDSYTKAGFIAKEQIYLFNPWNKYFIDVHYYFYLLRLIIGKSIREGKCQNCIH